MLYPIFKNSMIKFSVGDLVVLKPTYDCHGKTCVIVKIHKSDMPGDGGWISFNYEVVTESGKIVYITESCVSHSLK